MQEVVIIDPSTMANKGYWHQYELVKHLLPNTKTLRTFAEPAEDCLPRLVESECGTFDLFLTSPPYFDTERYGAGDGDTRGQCWMVYETVDDWIQGFLYPLIHCVAELLAVGGRFVLNLDNVGRLDLCNTALEYARTRPDLVFEGTYGLQKSCNAVGGGKRCEPIYVWRKILPSDVLPTPLDTTAEHVGQASLYMANYLTGDQEAKYLEWCRSLAQANHFQRYELFPWGNFLKKGPKVEWYLCDDQGRRAKYGWGQLARFYQAGHPMEDCPLVVQLRNRIHDEFGDDVNHAILKWYADGEEQSSPPHQDKAEGVDGATSEKCDMECDASFYVFSFGFPRKFTLQTGRGVPNPKAKETLLQQSDIVWQKALASGSLLKVSAEDNRTLFHALHRDKDAGERWSLIFRVIKTFIPIDAAVASEVNSKRYAFVSKAQARAGKVVPTDQDLKAAAAADAAAAAARSMGGPLSPTPTAITGETAHVTRDQLYWVTADNGSPAVSEDVFRTCKLVVFTQEEWDAKQTILSDVCAPIVKYSKTEQVKAKSVPWERYEYHREGLLARGFTHSDEATMVVVADGSGRFAVKSIYLPLDKAPELMHLANTVYDDDGNVGVEARGLSEFGKRGGTKADDGSMVMFGSHNFIPGPSHKQQGVRHAMPAVYNFNHAVNEQLNSKVVSHVNKLSEMERDMIPSMAEQRDRLADEHDPEHRHRMSEECSAFSSSLAQSYVVTAHDDSGKACETILFVNRHGPLPEGHAWDFTVGGQVHSLPNARGKAVLLFVEGTNVYHGTLPTSSTQPTLDHGNIGSALVTKDCMIRSLERQRDRRDVTPIEWTAKALYGGCIGTGDRASSSATDAAADTCRSVATGDPPSLPEPCSSPPALSAEKDSAEHGGDGGCTAKALVKLGIWMTLEDAVAALDAEITPVFAGWVKNGRQCDETYAGIRGGQWHEEVIKKAVVDAGWHFQKVHIDPTHPKKVVLKDVFTKGSYFAIGVTNNLWYKPGKKKAEPLKYPDEPADGPSSSDEGWVHSIAVTDGRVCDEYIEHEPVVESLSSLWLGNDNRPDPNKGYMRSVRKVWRVFRCCQPGTSCKGKGGMCHLERDLHLRLEQLSLLKGCEIARLEHAVHVAEEATLAVRTSADHGFALKVADTAITGAVDICCAECEKAEDEACAFYDHENYTPGLHNFITKTPYI